MKIALHGYGKMGKMVGEVAQQTGHQILSINRKTPKDEIHHHIKESDIVIDFSHADAVPKLVDLCIHYKKNMVLGTTNWENDVESVKNKVLQSNLGCIFCPNFSIGMALFKEVVAYAANLLLQDYDLAGIEYHHNQKLDAPSGMAKVITNMIKDSHPTVKLDFTSVRCGNIPGTHTLIFDGRDDTITLTHQARNRMGFATGALRAADWIRNKKGFYTINDLIKEIHSC